jgi:hypothetical protein
LNSRFIFTSYFKLFSVWKKNVASTSRNGKIAKIKRLCHSSHERAVLVDVKKIIQVTNAISGAFLFFHLGMPAIISIYVE